MDVAVIGAGAAGLAMARALRVAGHRATILERNPKLGGTWGFGLDRSAMYGSLRTNLPREVMGYWELPFNKKLSQHIGRDSKRYCGHRTVQAYLERYAEEFALHDCLRLNTNVERCIPLQTGKESSWDEPATRGPRWEVQTMNRITQQKMTKIYDALVVCNGHYSEPNVPRVRGADTFPGNQSHSHSYRDNSSFRGKRVVVVGAMASGEDIAREIAEVADEVHVAARRFQSLAWEREPGPFGERGNIHKQSVVVELCANGAVLFKDGSKVDAVDNVLWSTGYKVTFPFFCDSKKWDPCLVPRVVDNRVEYLYEHVFPPGSAPSLSFVGLLWKCVPFPMFELQATWIAKILSGDVFLPSRAEMLASVESLYNSLELHGHPVRHTHMIGNGQWDYNNRIAKACGCMYPLPAWRENLYRSHSEYRNNHPDDYRDTFCGYAELLEAEKWFESGRSIFNHSSTSLPAVMKARE